MNLKLHDVITKSEHMVIQLDDNISMASNIHEDEKEAINERAEMLSN